MSALQLRGVVREYAGPSETVRAVDGIDLTVAAGEMVALYGPSGSGKSTLLMLACGLLEPDRGEVRFGGRELGAMSAEELADYQRHDLGIVYQSAHLLGGVPAVENAAIKLLADGVSLKRARAAAVPWLERVGLAHRLAHTPEQLSGGERQRVAIARALVNEPRLILADEPTGSLDTRRGGEILTLLSEICRERGAAVLLVTHDAQAAELADRVCTLRDGRLCVEDGAAAVPARAAPAPGIAQDAC